MFLLSSRIISRIISIIYFISAFAFLFAKFLLVDDYQYLAFFEDDFFYYAETAKNFILHGFPSTDLATPTNGYHPIWFLIITIIQLPTQSPYFLTLCVTIISFISLILSFDYLNKVFIKLNTSANVSNYLSIIITSLFLIYFAQGMEIILLFPLISYLFYLLITENSNPFLYGLVFNLIFLSRLDTLFLLGFVYLYFILRKRDIISDYRFYVPFILSVIYIISNVIFFDTFLPVSGMAKQLKTSYTPVFTALESIFYLHRDRIIYGLLPFIFFISNFILLYFYKNKNFRLLFFLINLFPILFSAYNIIFSGWYYWSWYYYIFFPSIVIFFILIVELKLLNNSLKKLLPIVAILIILFYFHLSRKHEPNDTLFYENAINVMKYEKSHLGKYAMGDKAGMVAYLIESPLVQLEGLVMDKNFIYQLKSSANLTELLNKYNVDYYIANNAKKLERGYFVEEPYKIHKYVYTTVDTLFTQPDLIKDRKGWKMQIFDLRK